MQILTLFTAPANKLFALANQKIMICIQITNKVSLSKFWQTHLGKREPATAMTKDFLVEHQPRTTRCVHTN